jgi:hypothetical protein
MSLVVTYAPRVDESGWGYYRRLAADNVLPNWRELAGLAGIQRNRSALLMHADFVAGQLGLESEWANFASQQEMACRSWGRLHRAQTDAVCPDCLVEEGYLRHYWSHTYVTACHRHDINLVDRCNECDEMLSPNRYHIDRCECGHDLHMLPRIAATPTQQWLSALIASGGEHAGCIEPALCGVDVATLSKIIRILCLSADPALPSAPRNAASPKSIAEAVDLLAPLETLLAAWPAGFQSHVEKRIVIGKPDARTLNSLLGPWYIGLRKLCQGTGFEPLLKIIIEVAAVQFDGALGMDTAKAIAEEVTEYVRAPDAAKAIGVSVSRLHKAIEAGECMYRTRRVGTRGQIYEISRDEVTRIQQRRDEWITRESACDLIGVPSSVLEHMMSAGVIRADVKWRHDILKGGLVERCSLLDLERRIRDAIVPAEATNEERFVWSGLSSRRMGDKQAIQDVMRAISEGKVNAIECGKRFGDTVFLRTDVVSYFGTPLLEAGMSIQQLSKITGWKWESISHWINEGLLDSQSIMLRGQSCRVVLPRQLLEFRQTYVPLADLARGIGTKSSALSKLLSSIKFVGARQLPGGAVRGGLVRIADLCRLAVIGAKAGHDLFVPAAPRQ